MKLKFLGIHNAQSTNTNLVSFIIDDKLAIDAGGLASGLTFMEQEGIHSILISHGHFDHIRDIPLIVFNNINRIIRIYATPITLEIISSHLVDGTIYPNFSDSSSFLKRPALELCPLKPMKWQEVEGYQILTIPVRHTIDTVGFEITSQDQKKIFYTGDTGSGLSTIWHRINPHLLIMDMTFPNNLESLAVSSGHMCPKLWEKELLSFEQIKGYLPKVVLTHMSPQYEKEIRVETAEMASRLELEVISINEGEEFII